MTRIYTILSSVRFTDEKISLETRSQWKRKLDLLLASSPDIPNNYVNLILLIGYVSGGCIEDAIRLVLERAQSHIVDFAMTYCSEFDHWKALLQQILDLIRQLTNRIQNLSRKVKLLFFFFFCLLHFLTFKICCNVCKKKKIKKMKKEGQTGMSVNAPANDEKKEMKEEEDKSEDTQWIKDLTQELERAQKERQWLQQCYKDIWFHLGKMSSISLHSGANDKNWISVINLISLVPDDGNMEFFAPIFADLLRNEGGDLLNMELFEKIVQLEKDKDSVLSRQMDEIAKLSPY
ncbi:hypothetical protein RFI_24441 [Reticulomyxa filosa]|uniref:Uncharacterized protein n=1 Tax=Reticulomyxa filosa TaxID=46433 RepID=X6MIQ9_RETFI|nr:hypothetical protein RFI_24441 [Reticulomyxa filosa]|eukprot:ETO12935.1 hypothetical protein RFI_24441 [Reticulomyxa filosa]